jgi:hypothetical protein
LICESCDECHGETEGCGHGGGGREELGRPQGGGGTAGQGEDSRQAAPSGREAAQGLSSVLGQEIRDTLIFFSIFKTDKPVLAKPVTELRGLGCTFRT